MSKSRQQRKRQRQRRPRKSASISPGDSAAHKAPQPDKVVQGGTDKLNPDGELEKPQYGWVAIEHRDADGNPMLPRDMMVPTYRRLYSEVPPDAEIRILVLQGYKPKPLMLVERKIYEVHRVSVQGWRRRGKITVEVEGWRHHEADWFNAMRRVRLQISDPTGLPGLRSEGSDYIVSESSFDPKVVVQFDGRGRKTEVKLHEGKLGITETWGSAWRRHKTEVLSFGWKLIFAPLLVTLGAGLTLIWVDRTPNVVGNDSNLPTSSTLHEDRPTDGGAVIDSLEKTGVDQSVDSSMLQSASDTAEEGKLEDE